MKNFDFKTVQKTVGDRNHCDGFSLNKIAEFFNAKFGYMQYSIGGSFSKKLMGRVTKSLQFNVVLHSMVMETVQGKFTKDQLCCIFQAFNGITFRYVELPFFLKEGLFNFIEYEGQSMYDLGDVDAFKNKIDSLSSIEFAVFVDLIIEKWGYEGTDDEGLSQLLNYLKKE
jgi:hypothetical protein